MLYARRGAATRERGGGGGAVRGRGRRTVRVTDRPAPRAA
ncbi:hypothetical protein STTU_3883 [Streptomyces sp. Tu6071]|nr:hypothetical protein STTU_3883 [Streptomyces sp. Tu6071]